MFRVVMGTDVEKGEGMANGCYLRGESERQFKMVLSFEPRFQS